jgi:large subunit ribosomal protein L35
MPKIKTNRSAAKRFCITKRGKVKFKHALSRHHAWAKNRSRKRHMRSPGQLNLTDAAGIRRLLPYL